MEVVSPEHLWGKLSVDMSREASPGNARDAVSFAQQRCSRL